MTLVSPSSTKVDNFLSSISHLSKERLEEDQKRQRELQRDIDGLRKNNSHEAHSPIKTPTRTRQMGNDGISQLKFNRSARENFFETWKDVEPAPRLPRRPQEEEGPKFPPRPVSKPPMKPAKPASLEVAPSLPQRPTQLVNIGLIRPVARQEPLAKSAELSLPTYSASKSLAASTITLFADIERRIQGGVTSKVTQFHSGDGKPETLPNKPTGQAETKKTSPNVIADNTSTSKLETATHAADATINYSAKPKPELPKTKFSKIAEVKSKPAPPKKPDSKFFEKKDTELLKAQINRLSPTKTQRKNYSEKTTFQEEVEKFSPAKVEPLKPTKPTKPQTLAQEPPALLARGMLKPVKPAALKVDDTPEALLRLRSMRSTSKQPLAPEKPAKPLNVENQKLEVQPKAEFHAKLSNILRASTSPSLSAKAAPEPVVQRASTDPELAGKLTHPNKSRSKGPKRRLPKKTEPVAVPSLDYVKPKKMPPPIRAKKPNLEVKPRNFSGEVFL